MMLRNAAMVSLLALVGARVPAQEPQAPATPVQEEIKKLARKANEQLKEVNQLLIGTDPAAEDAKERLAKAHKGQEEVIKAIDEILKTLPPPRQSQSSSSSSQDQQQDKDKDKQKQEQKERERSKSPDLIKKDREEEKKRQQELERQRQREKEANKHKQKDKNDPRRPKQGKNEKAPKPPQNPQGKTPPQGGSGNWGLLPAWARKYFRKGRAPEIPEKYRALWREFQKRNREQR